MFIELEFMRISAQRIVQPSGRSVFAFAATADTILRLTEVPHIGRGDTGDLIGYQRPEIASHILEIRKYLDSPNAVLPNAIILAFDDSVTFEARETTPNGLSQWGDLIITSISKGENRPGFVVDGQQRLAAIAGCQHEEFPVFVMAMIAPNVDEQRKQFVLVNRTRPIPQGMIYELLPEIDGVLPQALAKQRLAAGLTSRLNLTPGSVLFHRIKSPTCPSGTIKDNSIRRTILNSLSDGALQEIVQGNKNNPAMQDLLVDTLEVFWKAVAETFPDAWSLPPKNSRLTHGVGIVAMGFIFDNLYLYKNPDIKWDIEYISDKLSVLKPCCAWTNGVWRFPSEVKMWNSLQNIDRDIRLLTSFLIRNLPPRT